MFLIATYLASYSGAATTLQSLSGDWSNSAPRGGVPAFSVRVEGSDAYVTIAPFKEAVKAKVYSTSVSVAASSGVAALVLNQGGRLFIITPTKPNETTLDTYTDFTDGSSRANYVMRGTFTRHSTTKAVFEGGGS